MSPARAAGRSALLLGVLILAQVACGPDRGRVEPQTSGAPTVRQYRVRGVIEAPPVGPGDTLRIRHEAIPDLVGPAGDVEGMAAMSMSFPLAAGLDPATLAAGDAVLVTLEVDWDAARPVVVTAIEPLAPGAS